MHSIDNIFDIKKKDIISITGSGGKTSLMFKLAESLKKKGNVLITTSTKIAIPRLGFDKIYLDYAHYEKPTNNQIVVLGEKLENANKLRSIAYENLINIVDDFDYVLIEADGCRNMPIKFWKKQEPVIYNITTKTIGVFSIKVYGKKPNSDFIYNYDEFIKNIGDNNINYKSFNKLMNYEDGLFKDFKGSKYVFFNQVEDDFDYKNIKEIMNNYKGNYNLRYGSIIKGEYYEN